MATVGRWMSRTLLLLLVLLVCVLVVAWFFLATDRGFGYTVNAVSDRVPAVELARTDGHLGKGVGVEQLSYATDSLTIKANKVSSDWQLRCLLRRTFCLNDVAIDELIIETNATATSDEPPAKGEIELPAIALPLTVKVARVAINTLRIRLPDGTEHVVEDIELKATSQDTQVDLERLALSYQNISTIANGKVNLTDGYPLFLKVRTSITQVVADNDLNIDLTLSNSLDDLKFTTEFSGLVQAAATGNVKPLDPNLPLDLTVDIPTAAWPLEEPELIRVDGLSLDINGDSDNYNFSARGNAKGDTVPDTSVSLRGQINAQRALLSNLEVNTLDGTVSGSAAVSFNDALSWVTHFNLDDINPGVHVPDADGSLNGEISASGSLLTDDFTLNVSKARIEGDIGNHALVLDTIIDKRPGMTWSIPKLNVVSGKNVLAVTGSVSDAWNMHGTLRMPELANLWPGLQGSINGFFDVTGPLALPDATVSIASENMGFNDLVVNDLNINAAVIQAARQPSVLVVTAGRVVNAAQEISGIDLALKGTRLRHALQASAAGPLDTAVDLAVSGGFAETSTNKDALQQWLNWQGSVDTAMLELPDHQLVLDNPFAVSWQHADQTVRIDPHCWVSEEASLCLEEPVAGSTAGNATVTLDNYLLNRLNGYLPDGQRVSGTVNLSSKLQWNTTSASPLTGTLALRANNTGLETTSPTGEPVQFIYDSVTLDAALQPAEATANLQLTSAQLGDARLALSLDPQIEERPIKGDFELQGLDISVAEVFVPQLSTIAGLLQARGEISGQLAKPRLDGEMTLTDPVIEGEQLPASITGGQLRVRLAGTRATYDGQLESGDGSIILQGFTAWDESNADPAPSGLRTILDIKGDSLRIVQEPLIDSAVFPTLRITATPTSLRVDGDIKVPLARIEVRELPASATTLSSDIVIVEEEAEAARQQQGAAPAINVQVRTRISLGDAVTLSAFGLDAALTGDFGVIVDGPKPPQLQGKIQVVKGQYKQYGQNLEVTDGEILFIGPIDQARLDIDAVREIDNEDRVAGLHLDGPLADPQVTLFTEPADKTDEAILSYVILGRDISEASDQESNLLATAALALTLKGSRGTTSGVAEKLGIEDFELGSRGSGDDTEVVFSGRLNNRLLVRYGQSIFTGENTLYLRYDLSKQLYLEAAQGAERAVDFFYSFSF